MASQVKSTNPRKQVLRAGAAATAPRPARYLSTFLGDDGVRTWSVIGRVGMPECRDGALREALSTFHRNTPQHELLLREANVPVWDGNLHTFGSLGAWERTHSCGFPDCTAEVTWTCPVNGDGWCDKHQPFFFNPKGARPPEETP